MEEAGTGDNSSGESTQGVPEGHWWYRTRSVLLSQMLADSTRDSKVVVNIGSSFTTARDFVPMCTAAVDLDRNHTAPDHSTYVCGDARRLPLGAATADVVLLLDVIEHFRDPAPVLDEACRVLKQSALLVVTVPAYDRLLSAYDTEVGHFRRYGRTDLVAEVERNRALVSERATYFFSYLVPGLLARKMAATASLTKQDPVGVALAVANTAARIERGLLRRMNVPFGTSVLAVFRKDGVA